MAQLNGYIKLHRKLIEWGWYSDHVVKDVFLHILMVAAYKEGQYRGYDIKPGDAVIGRKKLALELGFSEQQIKTALKKLESTGEITLKSTNRFTVATVENWAFYQGEELNSNQQITNKQPTDNQQITNKQPTDNQQITTSKESKESKEGKKVRNIYKGLPPELAEPFAEYEAMRKKIKKPMTERAVELQIKKLDRLSGGDVGKAVKILEESIVNCWQDLYPLKSKAEKSSGNPFIDMLEEN